MVLTKLKKVAFAALILKIILRLEDFRISVKFFYLNRKYSRFFPVTLNKRKMLF